MFIITRFLDTRQFKDGSEEMYKLYRQMTIYIFVWIQQGCLTNMVSALDPNSVRKRLKQKQELSCHMAAYLNKKPAYHIEKLSS